MKNYLKVVGIIVFCATISAFDIPQTEVPNAVVSQLQNSFSKIKGLEWEREGQWYKAEFETGFRGLEHEVWMDATGNIMKHKEDINPKDLPVAIQNSLNTSYSAYRVEDLSKITAGATITYEMELKSNQQEWKITFDANGKVLYKFVD